LQLIWHSLANRTSEAVSQIGLCQLEAYKEVCHEFASQSNFTSATGPATFCVIGFSRRPDRSVNFSSAGWQPDSGWWVSELNAPRPNSGREMAGGRVRALKKDGDGMAVIEITYLSRDDAGQADIDSEFSSFVSTVKSEYENKGLKASATDTKKATLGALPSSEVEITVVGQNKELRQWFSMALGKRYVYALSYTGEKQYYERFQPDFIKCRNSLAME